MGRVKRSHAVPTFGRKQAPRADREWSGFHSASRKKDLIVEREPCPNAAKIERHRDHEVLDDLLRDEQEEQ
jgi:hypothetical protein